MEDCKVKGENMEDCKVFCEDCHWMKEISGVLPLCTHPHFIKCQTYVKRKMDETDKYTCCSVANRYGMCKYFIERWNIWNEIKYQYKNLKEKIMGV